MPAPATRGRPSRRTKRGKEAVSEKENKTPSAKKRKNPQRACVTPSAEDPIRVVSQRDRAPKIRGANKTRHQETRNAPRRALRPKDIPKSNKVEERVPFEVISPNIECPSPLSHQSVEDPPSPPRQSRKRKSIVAPTRTGRTKRVPRTYGKRPKKRDSVADDDIFCF